MTSHNRTNLARIIRQQRVSIPLTLRELSQRSGVSPSHLGRIERSERFPSAHSLRKIAQPLGFNENELFRMAGYLPSQPSPKAEDNKVYQSKGLDPYVAQLLAQQPFKVQQAVIGILTILKSLAASPPEK